MGCFFVVVVVCKSLPLHLAKRQRENFSEADTIALKSFPLISVIMSLHRNIYFSTRVGGGGEKKP